MTGRTLAEARMSEAQWQRRITDLCEWLHLSWNHNPDSRRSNPGWPDLAIWGPGGFLLAELKTATGRVSSAQQLAHLTLEAAGVEVHVWRPSHWPEVQERLRELAVMDGGGA